MLLIVMHVQTLVKIHLFILQILNGHEILTSFKGRNSVMNRRKWTLNNPKLDVINFNTCVKFDQNQFLHSQDIERKRNADVIQGPQVCNELTKMDAQQSQARCRQYQCMCKLLSKFISFPKILSGNKNVTDGRTRDRVMVMSNCN